MSKVDDLKARAAQKSTYSPAAVGVAPKKFSGTPGRIGNWSPPPVQLPGTYATQAPLGVGSIGNAAGTTPVTDLLKKYPSLAKGVTPAGDGFHPLDVVKKLPEVALTAADILKRTYQATSGEVGDAVAGIPLLDKSPVTKAIVNSLAGNPAQLRGPVADRNTQFNPSEIGKQIIHGTQFLDHASYLDSMPNGWQKAAVGFAGDLVTDPITYLTAGVGGAAEGGVKAVEAGAGRTVLATKIVEGAKLAEEAGTPVAKEVVDRLAANAGRKGAAALTSKGLAAAGATAEDLAAMGIKTDFGLGVGAVGKRALLPGTERVGEAIVNAKGAVKELLGGRNATGIVRRMFTSAENGEAGLKQIILQGAKDGSMSPADAARALLKLNESKGVSYGWVHEASNALLRIPGFKGIKGEESSGLTHALELGDHSHPAADKVREWFDTARKFLEDHGVTVNNRENYMPHRLSDAARKEAQNGNQAVRNFTTGSLDSQQAFEHVRELPGTIDEINKAFREGTLDGALGPHNYDLLETDVHKLATAYMEEGQRALLTAGQRSYGGVGDTLIKEAPLGVDTAKVAEHVGALEEQIKKDIGVAAKARKQASDLGVNVATAARNAAGVELEANRRQLAAQAAKVAEHTASLEKLTAQAQAAEVALSQAEQAVKAAKSGVRGSKLAATEKVKTMQTVVDGIKSEIDRTKGLLDKATTGKAKLEAYVAEMDAAYKEADAKLTERVAGRAQMDKVPDPNVVTAQEVAQKAAEKNVQIRSDFVAAKGHQQVADDTLTWMSIDSAAKNDRLSTHIGELDKWIGDVKAVPTGKKADKLTQARELRDRLSEFRKIFAAADNPQAEAMASLEAQAAVADFNAWKAGARKATFEDTNRLLTDPKFQEFLTPQIEAGFRLLETGPYAGTHQVSMAYEEAIKRTRQFIDPATRSDAWKAAQKTIAAYKKGMQWWKGWATASPGFVVRNWYSGAFNMFVDGVSPLNANRMGKYVRLATRDGEEAAQKWALEKFTPEVAAHMSDALKVAAASGWGLTASEVGTKLGGASLSMNPLSSNNPVAAGIRHASSEVEAWLRGGHAFDVLERGGSYQEALARVEKFHFNYRDIGELDRAAKNVSPFWTFFSRNLSLQAEIYAKHPDKINRSYMNLKRNLEYVSKDNPDADVPWYLTHDLGGIVTPFGSDHGGRAYFAPDLPSVKFLSQMADPKQALIDALGPAVKIPVESVSKNDLFSGKPFKDSLTTYDGTGQIGRKAPGVLQLPGVKQAADLLPGTQQAGGNLLMTDRAQARVEDAFPLVSKLNRLAPNTSRGQDKLASSWLSFLGVPVKFNDPGSQAGERARVKQQEKDKATALALQAKLKGLPK